MLAKMEYDSLQQQMKNNNLEIIRIKEHAEEINGAEPCKCSKWTDRDGDIILLDIQHSSGEYYTCFPWLLIKLQWYFVSNFEEN